VCGGTSDDGCTFVTDESLGHRLRRPDAIDPESRHCRWIPRHTERRQQSVGKPEPSVNHRPNQARVRAPVGSTQSGSRVCNRTLDNGRATTIKGMRKRNFWVNPLNAMRREIEVA
jgi:hypothetical protein